MESLNNKFILTKIISLVLVGVFFLSACNVPAQPTADLDDAVEKAMQTLQAQSTQQAFETLVAQLTQVAQESPTSAVEDTATLAPPTATPTQVPPTATSLPPTATAVPPTATRIPPTATPIPCNLARFEKDVTVPDGTTMAPGEGFIKTWRLSNIGTCTWTTDYDLVFVTGTAMSAAAGIDLPRSVAPGDTIDLSIAMVAPTTPGEYTGYYMLRTGSGARFGVGKDALSSIWVKIKVVATTGEVYSFANKACEAVWSSGSTNPLPCPGSESNVSSGYVLKKNEPYREDGAKENEVGLITRPNNAADGRITGIYPSFLVQNGDKFRTTVNCEYNSPNCNVHFELKYRIGSGAVQSLFTRHEKYEGGYQFVEVDLSPLAGKNVTFILEVRNGTSSSDNKALWIRPSIWR